jgi:hypothetical protein
MTPNHVEGPARDMKAIRARYADDYYSVLFANG